jgi:excisionase family DNA binding protein
VRVSSADRRWASLDQAAEHLDVSTATIRRMISRGELPAYRLGKRLLRVDMNEVEAAIYVRSLACYSGSWNLTGQRPVPGLARRA